MTFVRFIDLLLTTGDAITQNVLRETAYRNWPAESVALYLSANFFHRQMVNCTLCIKISSQLEKNLFIVLCLLRLQ